MASPVTTIEKDKSHAVQSTWRKKKSHTLTDRWADWLMVQTSGDIIEIMGSCRVSNFVENTYIVFKNKIWPINISNYVECDA